MGHMYHCIMNQNKMERTEALELCVRFIKIMRFQSVLTLLTFHVCPKKGDQLASKLEHFLAGIPCTGIIKYV